jgi:hypothetical protein
LWQKYRHVKKESDLDSELIPVILNEQLQTGKSASQSFSLLFNEIYGMTNIALVHAGFDNLFLATNNGSLYYLFDDLRTCFIFASERYILKRLLLDLNLSQFFTEKGITKLDPLTALSVSLADLNCSLAELKTAPGNFDNINLNNSRKIQEKGTGIKKVFINTSLEHGAFVVPPEFIDEYHKRKESINQLRRCTKCLLPETFPFIEFDQNGVCNICKNYQPIAVKGTERLVGDIKARTVDQKSDYDCLVAFSGGRDSSYSLYYVKEKLGLKPLAFSYDWGMLTDLARRNQARVCGKLGIEHILISADIRNKRKNINLNVNAWLKKPSLGTIPLFMAGDKQYFYYANLLKKQNNIKLLIMGENHLEKTGFKIGFSGARQEQKGFMSYHISGVNKLRMLFYYAQQYAKNPAFFNRSLWDTTGAFLSYYLLPHEYLNIFDYLPWKEKEIEKVILNFFDWETDPGTKTTWRIGDGTAAFYNYIYFMVAGFTENDTFRSNQIREGDLTREEALKRSVIENQPRWDSIKWYCDTIRIDFEETIGRINTICPIINK